MVLVEADLHFQVVPLNRVTNLTAEEPSSWPTNGVWSCRNYFPEPQMLQVPGFLPVGGTKGDVQPEGGFSCDRPGSKDSCFGGRRHEP